MGDPWAPVGFLRVFWGPPPLRGQPCRDKRVDNNWLPGLGGIPQAQITSFLS